MRQRVAVIVGLTALALVASGLVVPVRDGLRLAAAPPGAGGAPPALGPEFSLALSARGEAFLAGGGIWFVDRLDDVRLAAVWRRPFRRGAVRIAGVPTPAWRGDFIYKRLMLGTQALILLLGVGVWWLAARRGASPGLHRGAPAAAR